MRKFVFMVVLIILAALVAGVYHFHFNLKPEFARAAISAMPRPVAGVAVEEARAETMAPSVTAIGTFRAVPGIDVSSQVAGVVAEIAFQNSQDVEKGALLVRLDDSTEQADLRSNLAMLKNANLAYERQKSLSATGVGAKANFDLAQAVRDQAAGAEDRTRALIGQKTIVAPFAGRLGIRKVDVGQYVAAGAPMVSLQQLDPIYLDFQVPEQDYVNLAVGHEIAAEVDALAGTTVHGKVSNIDARVDANTRSMLVRAEVANPDKKIMPGMFAHVDFAAGKAARIVTAPRTAVTYSLYGDSVFVVVPDDPSKGFDGPLHVERRVVKTGEAHEDRIVLLDGVGPGEKVVTEGQIKLQPNAPVRIAPDKAMKPLPVRPAP